MYEKIVSITCYCSPLVTDVNDKLIHNAWIYDSVIKKTVHGPHTHACSNYTTRSSLRRLQNADLWQTSYLLIFMMSVITAGVIVAANQYICCCNNRGDQQKQNKRYTDGDCLRIGKPSGYVTSHLVRLSHPPSVGWWNEYQLSGRVTINGDGGCSFLENTSPSAWSKGREPSGAVLHSSREPDELMQRLWVMMSAP